MKGNKELKESKRTRFKRWCENHFTEICMGCILVGGTITGIIIGESIGYGKGLVKHRVDHIDIANGLIDCCGEEGAFQALNYVKSSEDNYKKLLSDPVAATGDVAKMYYSCDFISKLRNEFDNEMKYYTKKK